MLLTLSLFVCCGVFKGVVTMVFCLFEKYLVWVGVAGILQLMYPPANLTFRNLVSVSSTWVRLAAKVVISEVQLLHTNISLFGVIVTSYKLCRTSATLVPVPLKRVRISVLWYPLAFFSNFSPQHAHFSMFTCFIREITKRDDLHKITMGDDLHIYMQIISHDTLR